jgi:deoxyribonuclease-4
MRIGSHLSISGGLHHALQAAEEYGFDCLALFVRNQVQWKAKPLEPAQTRRFRRTRKRCNLGPVVAHASYLINLAGEEPVRTKSLEAMVEDLTRCGHLGIEYLVLHPGAHDDTNSGIGLIAEGLDEILDRCEKIRPKILLETTAGQGRSIGCRFEHLAQIRRLVRRKRRIGVCLDTCHVFAAGYDLRTPRAWGGTLRAFDDVIGLEHLLAIHLNDSKRDLGARVDRHEHIGLGKIGKAGFAAVLNEPRLKEVPMILETPKKKHPDGRDWDEVNYQTLRSLMGRGYRKTTRSHS